MALTQLTSIRGQLVLWYLGVLAVLLVALGVFQSVTLSNYLHASTAHSLRNAAYQELKVLGPCYLRSTGDLQRNAQTLARLLGGHDTPVAIVNRVGRPLASLDAGSVSSRPWRVSSSTIHQLIDRFGRISPAAGKIRLSSCPHPSGFSSKGRRHNATGPRTGNAGRLIALAQSLVAGGGQQLLTAIPLGSPANVLGYAVLGRSLAEANATAARVLLVFALGGMAALLLAALVALPIINHALRPLRRVAGTAGAIAAGNLGERANLAHASDEIGRLGEAFDTMVDQLQAAISDAAASEERMRRFLADASHELRTPVTVLRGSSQVLLRQGAGGPPEYRAALRDMHDEATRLSGLVDDLLTLSRLDAGQRLAPETVVVAPFLHQFLDRYAGLWPERKIILNSAHGDSVGIDGEPSVGIDGEPRAGGPSAGNAGLDGVAVQVDPEALRRVMTNLVDNAVRYSRAGGAISIRGELDGDEVAISIADEGPGLSAEDAERIFDRFYRGKRSRAHGAGGTGLGLAIVRGLVEQSAGVVTIDTAPGRGTTVTVRLPCAVPRG